MSPSIWTQCGGKANIKRCQATVYRVIENQSQQANLTLVDNDEEADLLQEILDESKPPLPKDFPKTDKLIFTPFRYPPLKEGSRFGTHLERSIWYGSEKVETAFHEVIFHRYRFREDSPSIKKFAQDVQFTSFKVTAKSAKSVDLCHQKFKKFHTFLFNKNSYAHSQAIGKEMRADGVKMFKFLSARTETPQKNIGAFDPAVFNKNSCSDKIHWFASIKENTTKIAPYDKKSGKDILVIQRKDFGPVHIK